MEWIPHWNLVGKHAFLSPSGYSWLGYDSDKMAKSYENKQNVARGLLYMRWRHNLLSQKQSLHLKRRL